MMGLEIAYIGLTLLTLLFLVIIGNKAINHSSTHLKKDKIVLILALFIWQVVIFALSSTDMLKSYEFPPRFAIAFIVPSFIFTGIFLYRSRLKNWIKCIPEQWIIYFQSFRILVEILFVYSVAQGIFNYQVTIEGYNFDMIFAFTAPVIAFLVYNKNVLPRKILLAWNYLGLTVLASVIFLFLTSMYKPEIYGSDLPLLPLASMTYPHVLIAGFLNAFHLKIHTNGYQNLTENLDDVPDKFREVISPLNEIYTYNKYEIDKFDDRMDKITDRLMDELSTSKPWIHKFGENQPDDSLINYFLNDPFYKNALFIYKSGATNLCLEVEIFNLNATEAYKTIAKLTGYPQKLPDFIGHHLIDVTPQQLEEVVGNYTLVQIKTAVGDITIIDDPYTITLNNDGFELEDLQNGFSSPLYFKNDKELYSNNYKALLIRDKEKQLTGFIFKPFMGDELKFIKTD